MTDIAASLALLMALFTGAAFAAGIIGGTIAALVCLKAERAKHTRDALILRRLKAYPS